ncbi:MAG: hypothetical protein NTU44_09145 [Bacteroidetes bacterium]|nr:hypothetical protein [Bacteroidota bacterium]
MKKPGNLIIPAFLSLGLAALLSLLPCRLTAQQILVLEKTGTFKNYKYNKNDYISLKVRGNPKPVKGEINRISDSSIVVDYLNNIKLNEIEKIYRGRWVLTWLPRLGMIAGIGYISIDVLNNILNNIGPVFQPDVMKAGGILIGGALLLSCIGDKRYDLKRDWRLRVLNFDALKKEEQKPVGNGNN